MVRDTHIHREVDLGVVRFVSIDVVYDFPREKAAIEFSLGHQAVLVHITADIGVWMIRNLDEYIAVRG